MLWHVGCFSVQKSGVQWVLFIDIRYFFTHSNHLLRRSSSNSTSVMTESIRIVFVDMVTLFRIYSITSGAEYWDGVSALNRFTYFRIQLERWDVDPQYDLNSRKGKADSSGIVLARNYRVEDWEVKIYFTVYSTCSAEWTLDLRCVIRTIEDAHK